MKKTQRSIGLGVACFSMMLAPSALAQADAADAAAQPGVQAKGEIDAKAQEILDRAIDATFGTVRNIKTMYTEGSLEMPAQGMSMNIKVTMSEGKLLSVMEIPGLGEMRSGFDGNVGWQFSELTGPSIMEGGERDQLVRQGDIYADLNWSKYYSSVRYDGAKTTQDADGKDIEADVLVFTSRESGEEERRFFSKDTGLLVRLEGVVLAQGGARVPMMTLMGDYREIEGMTVPFLTRMQAGPNQMVSRTKKVEINQEIDADTFALPEEVAEMVE